MNLPIIGTVHREPYVWTDDPYTQTDAWAGSVETPTHGWRLLTPEEYQRAERLVAKASRTIRAEIPTVDARLAAVPPTLDAALVMDVCCEHGAADSRGAA